MRVVSLSCQSDRCYRKSWNYFPSLFCRWQDVKRFTTPLTLRLDQENGQLENDYYKVDNYVRNLLQGDENQFKLVPALCFIKEDCRNFNRWLYDINGLLKAAIYVTSVNQTSSYKTGMYTTAISIDASPFSIPLFPKWSQLNWPTTYMPVH